MWIPKSEADILAALATETLGETATFDAKRELPQKSKSIDLAKDVAAMANDGGVLLYGVGENEAGRPTVAAPFTLDGAPERVTAIVRSSIAEPPEVRIITIPTAADPTAGYLVVVIPPSPRAPHMVISQKDHRYYGRTATGNTPLTEGEVARLYQRRKQWEVDRDALLDQAIAQAPIPPHDDFAYLHLFIRPVASDEELLMRARPTVEGIRMEGFLNELLSAAAQPSLFPHRFTPDFQQYEAWRRQPLGWMYMRGERQQRVRYEEVLDVYINHDGSGRLFAARAAQRLAATENNPSMLWAFEVIIAGLTTRFLALFGGLYERAGYFGPLDVGLAVTGLRGAVALSIRQSIWIAADAHLFTQDNYRRTDRIAATSLATPSEVARRLVLPLTDTLTQGRYDPFTA